MRIVLSFLQNFNVALTESQGPQGTLSTYNICFQFLSVPHLSLSLFLTVFNVSSSMAPPADVRPRFFKVFVSRFCSDDVVRYSLSFFFSSSSDHEETILEQAVLVYNLKDSFSLCEFFEIYRVVFEFVTVSIGLLSAFRFTYTNLALFLGFPLNSQWSRC